MSDEEEENVHDITVVESEESDDEVEEFNFEDALKVRKNLSQAFDRHATASVAEKIARYEKVSTSASMKPTTNRPARGSQGSSTSLSVSLRIRPTATKDTVSTIEILADSAPDDNHLPTKVQTYPPADSNAARVSRESLHGVKQYEFQQVFAPESTQHQVYSAVAAPLVHGLFGEEPESALLFCYGVTNAGKSYTVMGNVEDQSNWGVIPRALQDIFARLEGTNALELYMSYIEVYNENVYDLLPKDTKPSYKPRATLKIREQQDGEIFVAGLTKHKVNDTQHGLQLAQEAKKKRHTSSNNINADSSRSHCICQLELSNGVKMWIVDLAGSERTKRTGVGAVRQKEAVLINTSLMKLMRCLTAMQNHQKVLPFRESKLTHLFMSHLTSGDSSRTSMIVNVNPASTDFDETQHVLGYAVAAKSIQINKDEYGKKRKAMGLDVYDMNGRKKVEGGRPSKISRLAKKFSPKRISKKWGSSNEAAAGERPPRATRPSSELDKLKREVSALQAQLSISQAEMEALRLDSEDQRDELAELEEKVRTEVSDEMEEHFTSTREEYDRIIENLQNQVKSNPFQARSEKKVKMDKAEKMVEELVDKVEECEEEMGRMREEQDNQIHVLEAEHSVALEAKEAYIRNLHEEHEFEIAELQRSKDAMAEMYQDQVRQLEEQLAELQHDDDDDDGEATVVQESAAEMARDDEEEESAADDVEEEEEESEDDGEEDDKTVVQDKENEPAVRKPLPRRTNRSRASKVACDPTSIPDNAPEKGRRATRSKKVLASSRVDENLPVDDEDLLYPRKAVPFDEDSGTYARPMGRAPRGREWDSQQGAWRLSVC